MSVIWSCRPSIGMKINQEARSVRMIFTALRRDLQAIEEGANPHHEPCQTDIDVETPFVGVMNRRQRQGSSQGAVKRSSQQTAKSDERRRATESQARDDEDETEAEHNSPEYLPNNLNLLPRFCNWPAGGFLTSSAEDDVDAS